MKVVLATGNQGKVKELRALLADLPIEVFCLADYPNVPEVVEDGATFAANAIKKAREIAAAVGEITLADDSGLEVDYLNGAPGVLSARFAGVGSNDQKNNQKLLQLLNGVEKSKRTARFKCVMAVATPQGHIITAQGSCAGFITEAPQGAQGFGYDPLFWVPDYQKTMAQLDSSVKNAISHRGRALAKIKDELIKIIS